MYKIITKTESYIDAESAKKAAATAILKELLRVKMEQKEEIKNAENNNCKEIA